MPLTSNWKLVVVNPEPMTTWEPSGAALPGDMTLPLMAQYSTVPEQLPVDRQILPEASGKVQDLAAVKSAEVIVPVKEAVAVVDWGSKASKSEFAVVDPKEALFTVVKVVAKAPDVWV